MKQSEIKILSLDTSSEACSVALLINGNTFESHIVEPKAHTQILIPMINKIIQNAGVTLSDLDVIVLGNGPGSFIGMRIGASVAQGLAFGLGLKIVPISSLTAIAFESFLISKLKRVLVAQEAKMGEVYLAEYIKGPKGWPKIVGEIQLKKITEPANINSDDLFDAAGLGWQLNSDLLLNYKKYINKKLDIFYPRAKFLLSLGYQGWLDNLAIRPEQLIPNYVRQKVAKKPLKKNT